MNTMAEVLVEGSWRASRSVGEFSGGESGDWRAFAGALSGFLAERNAASPAIVYRFLSGVQLIP
jgi:hypothetical protein